MSFCNKLALPHYPFASEKLLPMLQTPKTSLGTDLAIKSCVTLGQIGPKLLIFPKRKLFGKLA